MTSTAVICSEEDKRFGFGNNWYTFLSVLNEERILESEKTIKNMLNVDTLEHKTFLDIGSGSGLSSLVARRLGAKITSFDFDKQSVKCTQELRNRYFPESTDETWRIEQGSVLDRDYLKSLGQFDIVYSWGVLHHTGNMYQALDNVVHNVKPGGLLFIAIYNDEGTYSYLNTLMKKLYIKQPKIIQTAMVATYIAIDVLKKFVIDCLKLRNPLKRYLQKETRERGMSVWYDAVDWVGGYPFEVATPDAIFDFYKERGFDLVKLKTVGRGHACNQFIFQRSAQACAIKTSHK